MTLLERGLAGTATNVELAANWETAAHDLLLEKGLHERVKRLRGDFVDIASSIPNADLVILNRVVCCYPDWRTLLGSAVSRTDRCLVMSFPRPWSRSLLWIENLLHRLRGRSFRAYVHPPEAMIGSLISFGFQVEAEAASLVWRTVLLARGAHS